MKKLISLVVILSIGNVACWASDILNYSGRLVNVSGVPITGPVDMEFNLYYDTATLECTKSVIGVTLTNGVFNVALDFSGVACSGQGAYPTLAKLFDGANRNSKTVSIEVRDTTTPNTYPKQDISPGPMSIYSESAASVLQYSDDTHAAAWGAAQNGKIWYNTTDNKLKIMKGGAITELSTGTGSGTVTEVTVTAPLAVLTGTTTPALSITYDNTTIGNSGGLYVKDDAITMAKLSNADANCATAGKVIKVNPGGTAFECLDDDTGSSGVTTLNTLTGATQTLSVGTAGTAPAWTSAAADHKLDIPMASTAAVTAGLISKADYDGWLLKTGGTMSGNVTMGAATQIIMGALGQIDMATRPIVGLADPVLAQDAATKAYVDTMLPKAGGTMTGAIAMGTSKITGLGDPTLAQDAATKNYIDTTALLLAGGSMTGLFRPLVFAGVADDCTDGATDEGKFWYNDTANIMQYCKNGAVVSFGDSTTAGVVSLSATLPMVNTGTASNPVIAVDYDNTTIGNSAGNKLEVKDSGITSAKINDGTIVNIDVGAGAAIAESKLALDFSTSSLNTAVGAKLPLAGGTMTGAIAMGTSKITGLGDPTLAQDAATKKYVDDTALLLAGGTMSGNIAMGGNDITGADAITATSFTGSGSALTGVVPAGVTTDNTIIGIGAAGASITTAVRNTMLGENTGASLTEGTDNMMFGESAGQLITTGSYNVGVGTWALYNNDIESYNTGVGTSALQGMAIADTGDKNTAIGAFAGQRNSDGANNVAIGYAALQGDAGTGVDGSYNTAVGYLSQTLTSTGAYNTSVGSESLQALTTGSNNTAVGYYVLEDLIGGNNNTGSGYYALQDLISGSGNTAIGHTALGDLTTGSNNTAIGYLAGQNLSLASARNVAIGEASMDTWEEVTDNIAIGTWTLANTSADGIIAIGTGALQKLTAGAFNIALGSYAAQYLTGSYNLAFGTQALIGIDTLSTGSYNTAVGVYSSRYLTTGTYNLALGYESLSGNAGGFTGSFNVAIGAQTMLASTTGAQNTIVGHSAASGIIDGATNVAIGYGALDAATSGSTNVSIGGVSGASITTGTGNVLLGNAAGPTANASNKLFIDNSQNDTPLIWGDFATNNVVINGNAANNINSRTFFVNGTAGGTDVWNNDSDERLKRNIATIDNALERVLGLRGVTYEWRSEEYPDRNYQEGTRMGFIAQEAEDVIPEVVSTGVSGFKSMAYAPITAILVEATKEQQSLIKKNAEMLETLKEENAEIKAENQDLRSELDQLKSEIAEIKQLLNK